jgi:diadenosine hexaphosphate hydrolase (ATP-forming)
MVMTIHNKRFDQTGHLLKAGGLIVRDQAGRQEVLLISSNRRSWSFPKGHLEPDETLEQCAVRECEEETGLRVEIIKELPVLEYKDDAGTPILVQLYQMRVISGQLTGESSDVHLEWVPVDQAAGVFDYQNLRDYIKLATAELV